MGRATVTKEGQLQYLENRIKLLHHVVLSLKPEKADQEDLKNVLKMLDDLRIKVQRFHDDWSEENDD